MRLYVCTRCGAPKKTETLNPWERCLCGARLGHCLIEDTRELEASLSSSTVGKGTIEAQSGDQGVNGLDLSEARSARRRARRGRCRDGTLGWLVGPDQKGERLTSAPQSCNTRGCTHCDLKRGLDFRKRIVRMLKASNGERTLLTFTRSSETWSRIESYLELAAAVRRWWRVVVQRFPTLKGTPRAWVIEPHKSGWAHIHMVIAAELPRHAYAWYIERWRRAVRSESARMNVRRTAPGQKIEQAAWYVAKYVTKCASELGIALLDQLGRRRVMGSTPGWKEKLTPAWPWVLVASVRDPLTAPVDLAVRLGPPPSRLGEAGRPQAPPAPVSTLAGARPAGFASLDARYRAW